MMITFTLLMVALAQRAAPPSLSRQGRDEPDLRRPSRWPSPIGDAWTLWRAHAPDRPLPERTSLARWWPRVHRRQMRGGYAVEIVGDREERESGRAASGECRPATRLPAQVIVSPITWSRCRSEPEP